MGSLLPPVRRPRCGRAKWLAQDHPPSKWQDGIRWGSAGSWGAQGRQLARFLWRHPCVPKPARSKGSPWRPPLPPSPWVLVLAARRPPQLPQGRGSRQPSSPCTGSLPGDPARTNSRPRMLPDRGVVLWDTVLGAILSSVPVTVSPHPQKEARSSGRVQQPRAQTLVPPAQKQPAGPMSKPSVSPLSHNFYIYKTSLGFKIGPVSVRHRDG